MHSLIIDVPEVQSRTRKFSYTMVTLVFWSIYFYMWLPLISLLAWVLGFRFFYQHMIVLGGYQGFLADAKLYFMVILSLSTIFIVWAKINLYRFNDVERRKGHQPITQTNQAEYYHLDENDIKNWQGLSHMVIHHDENGYPIEIIDQQKNQTGFSEQLDNVSNF